MTRSAVGDSRDLVTVTVVLVTYGDRHALLGAVLEGLDRLMAAERIARIVIVDNGSSERSREFLRKRGSEDPRLRVVSVATNSGSAGGFRVGLAAALEQDCDLVWVLDDDNRPEPNALAALLAAAKATPAPAAFLSLRSDRPQYAEYAAGGRADACFGGPDSFLSFSWDVLGWKALRRLAGAADALRSDALRTREVPYGPYGGLFVPREILAELGLPREDFYLYGDDHEFTHRITRRGVPILLVPGSRLIDLDRSWNAGAGEVDGFYSNYVLTRVNPDVSRRIYYSVRNRVFFETRCLVRRPALYALNVASFLLVLACLAIVAAVLEQTIAPFRSLFEVVRGAHDGLRGRLGRRV